MLRIVSPVVRQAPVFDPDDAVCNPMNPFIVGRNDDADVLFLHRLPKQSNDHVPVFRIEIRRGLIGQDDLGAVYQSPGKGDALLFSCRKVRREVMDTMAESYALEDFNGAGADISGTPEEKITDQGHILPGGQGGQEIEALENESDGFSPKPSERP